MYSHSYGKLSLLPRIVKSYNSSGFTQRFGVLPGVLTICVCLQFCPLVFPQNLMGKISLWRQQFLGFCRNFSYRDFFFPKLFMVCSSPSAIELASLMLSKLFQVVHDALFFPFIARESNRSCSLCFLCVKHRPFSAWGREKWMITFIPCFLFSYSYISFSHEKIKQSFISFLAREKPYILWTCQEAGLEFRGNWEVSVTSLHLFPWG